MYGGRSQVAWPCPPQAGGHPPRLPNLLGPLRCSIPHIKIILMKYWLEKIKSPPGRVGQTLVGYASVTFRIRKNVTDPQVDYV